MTPSEFRWVERCARLLVPRARAGDDEALEGLVYEVRPAMLSLDLGPARHQVDVKEWTEIIRLSILEAVILWQPENGSFADVVYTRARSRIGDYFLRRREMIAAVMSTGGDDDKRAERAGD